MSSILRALKKLESEPRHLEENQPLDSKFVPLAETEPQRTFRSIFMVVLGGGIVCGLVVLAGWWFLSEKPQSPPPQISQSSFQSLQTTQAIILTLISQPLQMQPVRRISILTRPAKANIQERRNSLQASSSGRRS